MIGSLFVGARIGILAADPGATYGFYTMISMVVELLMWATRKEGVVKSYYFTSDLAYVEMFPFCIEFGFSTRESLCMLARRKYTKIHQKIGQANTTYIEGFSLAGFCV